MHPLLNGAIAALTVAALSFVVVLGVTVIGWVLAADHSSLGAMFQVAILGWLTVHLVPVSTVGGWLWLPPLVLTVGVGWLARRVGQTTLRRGSVTDAAARWRVFGAAAVTYAVVATVLAWAATGAAARVPLWLVPFATAAVFAVGFAPVIARTSQRLADLRGRIPEAYLSELRASLKGLAVLAIGGAAVLLAAMVASWGQIQEISADLRPGFSGTLVLVLATLVYLPTAVVWAASFLTGAGVSLGEGAAATPFAVTIGDLPSIPLLAAAPDRYRWWYVVGLVVALAAGVVTARAVTGSIETPSLYDRLIPRLRAAVMAAAMAGVAGVLTHGTLGGRLSDIGPNPAMLALSVLLWFLIGAAVVSGLDLVGFTPRRTRARRRTSRARSRTGPTFQEARRGAEEVPSWSQDRTVVLADEDASDLGR